MNIWIVNHYAIPPSEAGGTRHHNFALNLSRLGSCLRIITSSFKHNRSDRTDGADDMANLTDHVEDGVAYQWVRTPAYSGNSFGRLMNMLLFSWRVYRWLPKAHLEAPHVVVGSSPQLFSALAAYALAKKLRVPFVLEIRDIWPKSLVDLAGIPQYHPLILLLRVVELFLYRRADHIITLLPGSPRYLEALGVPPEQITWLPNSVALDGLPQPTAPVAPPLNGRFLVIYAGAHGLANDLDVVLDAAALAQSRTEANSVMFRLVGDGPEKQRLQERAARLGLSNVEFAPAVPKSQVWDELAKAQAAVMVLKESKVFEYGVSPNKLFDYMASSLPVVFSVSTPYNPVAMSGAGLTVTPGDAEALLGAIVALQQLPERDRVTMGGQGRQFVEEHHDAMVLAERLNATLTQLVQAHGKRGQ